jgi:hypothetical protein
MRLYHHTNRPQAVLSGDNPEDEQVELVLTASSSHLADYDVLLRIEVPDSEMDRLMPQGHSTWTTTLADLNDAGAEIDCASEDDRERVAVYALAAQRQEKLETIAKLRRYIDEEQNRPEASQFAIMLRAHQDHLTDIENAIDDGSRRFGVRHLQPLQTQ